jgi:hypothetical protein
MRNDSTPLGPTAEGSEVILSFSAPLDVIRSSSNRPKVRPPRLASKPWNVNRTALGEAMGRRPEYARLKSAQIRDRILKVRDSIGNVSVAIELSVTLS